MIEGLIDYKQWLWIIRVDLRSDGL